MEKAQQELEQIERQVAELRSPDADEATRRQIEKLQDRIEILRQDLSAPPTAWQRTELARHPQRPQSLDYIERIFTDFSEIHGDRSFGDDAAIICGMARFHGDEVLIVATQKGRDMKQRVHRNFGTPHPEGYRGVGGSGGALAIAVADRVLMMENSIYSVISPEGCAAIMWRDSSKKELAAEAMRITANDLSELGCIDDIVPEPEGGAHRDHEAAAALLDASLQKHFNELKKIPPAELLTSRYGKFRNMAQFYKTG